jgi:hypothetical protein
MLRPSSQVWGIITLTKQEQDVGSIAAAATASVGAGGVIVNTESLAEAIVAELMDYFSVPSVSGLWLGESQARWIASGIILRVQALNAAPTDTH